MNQIQKEICRYVALFREGKSKNSLPPSTLTLHSILEEYDPVELEQAVAELIGTGKLITRSFHYWLDFAPNEYEKYKSSLLQ